MHVVWILSSDYFLFCYLFSQVELSHISSIIYNKVNGQEILCGATFPAVLYPFLRNFTGVLVMV